MDTEHERLIFSVREVAKLLGLSKASTYEAVRIGSIPSLKVGRRILIPKVALQDLLNRHLLTGDTGDDTHDIHSSKSGTAEIW